jgi:hypothetical protein
MVHGYSPVRVPGKQSSLSPVVMAVIKDGEWLMGLIAAFWAVFGYASWTINMAILTP